MRLVSHTVLTRLNVKFCSYLFSLRIGEKLVNFLVEPKKGTKWPKELPKFNSRPDAIAICKDLCASQFIHRSEKVAKGELEVRPLKWLPFCVWLCVWKIRQHFLESPMGPIPCPYWCYMLPTKMLRDSSCLDVIEHVASAPWSSCLSGGS